MAGVAVGSNNNKATNIALLLQNLDYDRTDDFLDVSRLKDFSFSEFDLNDPSATMENEISTKLNDSAFTSEYIKTENPTLIDMATAKADMKKDVEEIVKKNIDVSKLVGKEYLDIECSELIGCEKVSSLISFPNNETLSEKGEGDAKLIKQDNGDLKIIWEEDDIEYLRILDVSENVVSICWYEDKSKPCTNPSQYLVQPNVVDSFIKNKEKNMSLLQKEKVTKFSEIQNKKLWQLESWNNSLGSKYITIDSDGKFGNVWRTSYYNATFDDGILHITGYDGYDKEDYDRKEKVYKYKLAGKSISIKDFAFYSVFDDEGLISLLPNKVFDFTKGNMYCHILNEECWVDDDAIEQMKSQAGIK